MQAAMPMISPVSNVPADFGGATPAASVNTSDAAPILAAATMAAIPLPDASLVSMMQSMAGLSSGVTF
jgi:hypothetical protein